VKNESAVSFLTQQWIRAGIRSGDMLLLHSSTARDAAKTAEDGLRDECRDHPGQTIFFFRSQSINYRAVRILGILYN
jgi:hypothetical protein